MITSSEWNTLRDKAARFLKIRYPDLPVEERVMCRCGCPFFEPLGEGYRCLRCMPPIEHLELRKILRPLAIWYEEERETSHDAGENRDT